MTEDCQKSILFIQACPAALALQLSFCFSLEKFERLFINQKRGI